MFKKFFNIKSKPKKSASKPRRRLPERKLAPVEEIVEQGLLVANVAARMNVKNAIIMNALRNNVDFDRELIEEFVRQKLAQLAGERAGDAKHIKRVRDEVRKYGRSAWQETEYGSDDYRTLKHRQEVYEMLAEKLQAEADDDEFVIDLASQARDQAWVEIGESLKDRAQHPYYSGGKTPEYKRERESRIQQFIEDDLAALAKKNSKKSKFKQKNR